MLKSFSVWLSHTPLSELIQNVLWIIPLVQTIHILAIAIVLSSVGMLALRLFGVAGTSDPMAETARRFMPWVWTSLAVLAVTGALLITGEPVRSLINPAFQLKMVMLVAAIFLTGAFQASVRRGLPIWSASQTPGVAVKSLAVVTLALWVAIPVAGRWIAYMVTGE